MDPLVVRCQLGQRPALSYYLGRMLDQDDVADLEQEVWLAVIRCVGQLRNPEAFVVWLYQIARRKALSRLTARQLASLDADEMSEEIAGDSQPPSSRSPHNAHSPPCAQNDPRTSAAVVPASLGKVPPAEENQEVQKC